LEALAYDLPSFVFHALQSSVLRDLSSMQRLVVATGGGAVIRPVNWYLEFTLFFPLNGSLYFL
jgi:hypothetical protein